jgi:hypothetical protein
MFSRFVRAIEVTIFVTFWAAALSFSTPPTTDQIEHIRAFSRQIEFDYLNWTVEAAFTKLQAASVGLPNSLDPVSQKQIVLEYLRVTQQELEKESQLEQIFADATINNKVTASASLLAELTKMDARQSQLAPLAESILQEQISQILADLGLTSAGQPIPNVLYHVSQLPLTLIVSPRERIEQIANISIETNLPVDKQAALETRVDKGLNVSSLVVPIGGVGVYPTMVMRSSDLRWLTETISHEWTHNYLTLRPLGALYDSSPELRTMNETTASITGAEVGELVLRRFYPELSTASTSREILISFPRDHPDPRDLPRPSFDFRAAMHETRVVVDTLLADGKVDQAEAYMEQRRLVFLEHGYLLRKINQAYFAFYGAYADVPGGAAGEDPVGPAVRALRAQSNSLADFVNRIAWMTNFEQLQKAIQ